jgi:hypothetical protein
LRGAKNKEQAFMPMFCKWYHAIVGDKIKIGCKKKLLKIGIYSLHLMKLTKLTETQKNLNKLKLFI